MGFDKSNFAYLLKRALGRRSINEYASASGISAAHISRLMRGLLDSPPTPQTIEKLAKYAHGGVTYDQFMEAAGYGARIKEETAKYETSEKIARLIPKLKELSNEDIQTIEKLVDAIRGKGGEAAATEIITCGTKEKRG